jgi:hypothetical protein
MLDSLQIEGFRGFARFEVKDLARINLLVGTNNCGKTALLEALTLWWTAAAPNALEDVVKRRDEHLTKTEGGIDLAVRHLFHGHRPEPGQTFTVIGRRNGRNLGFRASIEEEPGLGDSLAEHSQPMLIPDAEPKDTELREGPLVLRVNVIDDRRTDTSADPRSYSVRLTVEGDLPVRLLRRMPRSKKGPLADFIPTRSLSRGAVAAMFGGIVLTDEEKLIIDALRIIDPSIERLALAGGDAVTSGGSGLFVRCEGQSERIPIGSMGDGIWRLLSLSLALVQTRGGALLVDEIDTGLHFSAMVEMWKLVIETAQRLDVQVFATTHSRDCYESLAAVLRDIDAAPGTAAIHRIERDKGRTVVYDQSQIIIAAEDDIEVR